MLPDPTLSRLRRVLAASLAASWLFSAYLIFFHSTSDLMTPGNAGSDHLSHANATVVFFYRGVAIYRSPVNELLQHDDSPAAAELAREHGWSADELFRLPERARPDAPLWLNWVQLARVYPPGVYCYTAAEGLFLERTDLPLWAVCAFSLLKYSLAAHLLLWFLFDYLLCRYPCAETLWGVLPGWALLLPLLAAVQVQVCFWTRLGFYDAVAVLFLVLMVTHYKRRLWVNVLFFFAAAVFLHFRSLWFFPVAGLAAVQLARQGVAGVLASRRETLLLLSAVLLLGVSGCIFLLAYPELLRFPLNNPLYLRTLRPDNLPLVPLGCFAVLVGVLLWRRDWLLLASLAGVLLFLLNTRQLQHWHSLALVPLLLCSRENTVPGLVRGAASYAAVSFLFMQVMPFDPTWAYLYYLGI